MYIRFIRDFATPDELGEEASFESPEDVDFEVSRDEYEEQRQEWEEQVVAEVMDQLADRDVAVLKWLEDPARVTVGPTVSTAQLIAVFEDDADIAEIRAALAEDPVIPEPVSEMEMKAR